MKRCFIILFFAFITFSINAGSKNNADNLFTEAQSLYNDADYNGAIKGFNDALSLYEKTEPKNKQNRGIIDIWIGACYFKLNDFDNSIKYYEESIDILKKNNDKDNLINAINAICNTYMSLKNYEKIIEYYKIAVSIFEELKKPDMEAVYLSYIGGYYYYLKKSDEAIGYYSKAVELYKKLNNYREVFNNLNNIGGTYFYDGDKNKAAEYYKQAYESGKKFLKLEESIQFINNIAAISQEIKNYGDAIKYNQLLEEIYKNKNDDNNLYMIYHNIGVNYYLDDKKDLALKYYLLSYETGKDIIDEKDLIDTLNRITNVSDELDDYKTSIEYYTKLAMIYEKNKSVKDLSQTYNNIGFYFNKQKDYQKAINYYDKAKELAVKINDKELISSINYNFAYCYYDSKNYKESILYFNEFLKSDKKIEGDNYIVNAYILTGSCYANLSLSDDAIKNYQNAEKLADKINDKGYLLSVYENYADFYSKKNDHTKAMEYYNRALNIAERESDKKNYAIVLSYIGSVYSDMEDYNKAIDYYTKALDVDKSINNESEIATQYGNIGHVYHLMSEFDKALMFTEQSLKYFEKSDEKEKYVYSLNNMGEVFRLWAKYDKALEYYNKALKIADELQLEEAKATLYNNYGMLYKSEEDYDKSLDYFSKSLVIEKNIGDKVSISINLSNIGETYRQLRDFDKASKYFLDALAIDKELGIKSKIANRLNGIGLLYSDNGNYEKSNEYIIEAMKYTETSNKNDMSIYYGNLGFNYCLLKQYDKAEDYLNKSIVIKEELRNTATGDIKMDYLASQIFTYQMLIFTYASEGKIDKALEIAELSRAKYLTERISGRVKKDIVYPGLDKIMKNIDSNTIVISFSNVNKYFYPLRIVITKDKIDCKELTGDNLKLNEDDVKKIYSVNEKTRGLKIIKSDTSEKDKQNVSIKNSDYFYDKLSNLVYYFRSLLADPNTNFIEDENANKMSKSLYDYFFDDIKEQIKDKKNIIIIPDNILGLLPFETLVDGNNKYIAENHDVKYSQSLTVINYIKDRKYSENRQPVIAFGGAVYDKNSYKQDMSLNEKEYDKILKNSLSLLSRGNKDASVYDYLRGASWENLPGTLSEVKSIGKIFLTSKIFTDNNVNEKNVKALSKNGELEKYKVIHFATHGLTVPDSPELSALVLSQSDKINNDEDGYLQSNEIANLDLKADFVNLSACETGLGKIYGGEGIVGLSQSFIIAGANAVSVSLWEVADESTMIFMNELYKLINEKKMNYLEAESYVKRLFIKDKKFANPYYWAPFVYYGM